MFLQGNVKTFDLRNVVDLVMVATKKLDSSQQKGLQEVLHSMTLRSAIDFLFADHQIYL